MALRGISLEHRKCRLAFYAAHMLSLKQLMSDLTASRNHRVL